MNVSQLNFQIQLADKNTQIYALFFKYKRYIFKELKKAYDSRQYIIEDWKYRLLSDFLLDTR